MHMPKTEAALKDHDIEYTIYTEDGCESIEFMFRGLAYHIWEWHEDDEWGVEQNVFNTGRSEDLKGDYDETLAKEIMSWPYMIHGTVRNTYDR